jgi:glutaredoxin 3
MAIEFFSSPDCGYCEKAKALLKGKGVAFSDLDIVADQASRDEFARRLPRTRSLPQIFVDGRHIGTPPVRAAGPAALL